MLVHEMAKSLGVDSKEITSFLATKDIKKTASSKLSDEEVAIVNGKFKPAPKAEPVKPAPKADAPKTPATDAAKKNAEAPKAGEAPKKKSSMTFVFNGQNSSRGAAPKRPAGAPGQGRPNPNKGTAPSAQSQSAGLIRVRDKSERTVRSASERHIEEPVEEIIETKVETPVVAEPKVEAPVAKPAKPETEKKPEAEKKNYDKPQNDRRPQGDRPQGDRRPDGDRKPFNSNGDRNKGGRNEGFQRGPQGNKENNGFKKGDASNSERNRGGNNFGQNRPGQSGGKFDKGRNSAPVAAPVEEVRGKDRDNRKHGNNQNQNKKNYDNQTSKKAERFVNLEKQTGHKKRNAVPQAAPVEDPDTIKSVVLPEKMTIKELGDRLKIQAAVIVKKLFMKGQMVTLNQEVSYEEAEEIALEFNFIAEPEEKVDVIAELLKEDEEAEETLIKRPPVVCVMGHVDHGKTSLLDAIRHTKVTDKEAGGITQAIGAYTVEEKGEKITFLDTPGHEAFTAMRMRGANSTDIAILVVAADDGVMPQTVEAINHAKAAGVEIIVAINKIDKPAANIDKVKQELSEYELIPEDWGGSTVFCPVSAHTKEGIDNLLDMILLTADVLELKANPKRNARGLVIEAELDKGRGVVATVLVQKGTLKVGQPIACGSSHGKVRAMLDENGKNVKEAKPSTPVAILGLDNVPSAGETFMAFDSDKEAKAFADTFISEGKNKLIEETKAKMSLDDLFSQIKQGNVKELNIIVKADVQGSVEAVRTSLTKLSNEEVIVKVIHGGVGAINESDVILASASNAIIIGFNVRPDVQAKTTADREGVDVRLYKVIYNAIEDVEAAMKGMLDPIFEEKILGHAEVRQVFKASGIGNIAGSYVLDGTFERGCKVRLTREGELLCDVPLASLKRFKDDVKEVKTGFECGLVLDGWSDIQEFDIIEAYKMVEVPR